MQSYVYNDIKDGWIKDRSLRPYITEYNYLIDNTIYSRQSTKRLKIDNSVGQCTSPTS